MASLSVFSIKDVKAKAFMHPFFTHNAATAEREFRRVLKDPSSQMCHNPEDFELYQVGVWNDEVGVVLASEVPELVITGKAIFEMERER